MILRKVDYRTRKNVAEEPTNQNTISQAIRVQSNEPMDTKRRSHKRKRSYECFLFSVYASNYDSDCVVSENQPVKITFTVVLPIVRKHKNNPLYSFL